LAGYKLEKVQLKSNIFFMAEQQPHIATAFLSCSLRNEDKPFIDFIEKLLEHYRIKPFGTIGKYSVAPINIAEHMKQNIPLADMVVIIATPRYLQRDLQNGDVSYGLSEMVHVETGMAYMAGKPVVVFAQEGTHVGNFLPNITEYIILNGQDHDLQNKISLINSLLKNAYSFVRKTREKNSSKETGKAVTAGLAIWGGLTILDAIFSDDKPTRKRTVTKRKR
jgi:hypothetical protein